MADTTNVLVLETPILPALAQRRSPRAYRSEPVPTMTNTAWAPGLPVAGDFS